VSGQAFRLCRRKTGFFVGLWGNADERRGLSLDLKSTGQCTRDYVSLVLTVAVLRSTLNVVVCSSMLGC